MKYVFFLLFCTTLFAQELSMVKEKPLKANRFIGIDSYDHLYTIKEGVLYKEGDLGSFVFKDYQLGPISSVDIINPLNVVVFYAEVNTVVFLDNRLSEKERINFNTLSNFINVSHASNAGNNRLWLFNADTQQLQLYNYRNTRETILSQPYPGTVKTQISNFNDCYLLTEDTLWQVNIYGSLLSERPMMGFETIVRNEKNQIGLKENAIYYMSNDTIIPLDIPFSENPIKDLQLTQDFLYIYDGNVLRSFTLTQPKQ